MNQYDEDRVREALEPYHSRIRAVIVRAHGECWSVKRHMAEKGFGPVLYPRTDANDMFDAVARNALREFSDNPDVRVIKEAQTVKICFAGCSQILPDATPPLGKIHSFSKYYRNF